MQEKDLRLLWMFTLRIGMYTGKENPDTISAFIHGYETGRDQECKFIKKLKESIEAEYKIESKSTGWIGQIERLAEQLEVDWTTVFKKQSLKILTKEFNEPMKKEFVDSLKKRIDGKMVGVRYYFRRDWITDWYGIIDLAADWFKEIWSNKELQLLTEIEEELQTFGSVRSAKMEIKPTEKLKNICEQFHKEMVSSK